MCQSSRTATVVDTGWIDTVPWTIPASSNTAGKGLKACPDEPARLTWVLDEAHVGGQHHQVAGLVLVLGRAIPLVALVRLLGGPLLLLLVATICTQASGRHT